MSLVKIRPGVKKGEKISTNFIILYFLKGMMWANYKPKKCVIYICIFCARGSPFSMQFPVSFCECFLVAGKWNLLRQAERKFCWIDVNLQILWSVRCCLKKLQLRFSLVAPNCKMKHLHLEALALKNQQAKMSNVITYLIKSHMRAAT